jgi:hypothetical protein
VRFRFSFSVAVALLSFACARAASSPGAAADAAAEPVARKLGPRVETDGASSPGAGSGRKVAEADAGATLASPAPAEAKRLEPDGNDDDEDPGSGAAPTAARWEKVGTPPLALTRICDLTPFDGALYAAHANQPLGTDGATITRYRPGSEDPKVTRPFSVAFDWNRPGEPTKGGGAGQGFVRVHAIGGRLFVPDADPPYGGLALVDHGTEGYVFSSDDHGAFPPPRAPHFNPPAKVGILPRAYHVIDVVEFRGALYASTGSVPPSEHAWRGPSPGALHRANDDRTRWIYEVDYPFPWQNGVWRITYMVRFADRLYAGIQDFDGRDPNDFLVISPPPAPPGEKTVLRHEDIQKARITPRGGSATLRWWVDTRAHPARLYWLAWTAGGVRLRLTTDGDHWAEVPLPDDSGRPTDVTRFRDAVVILTERGLYRLTGPAIDAPGDLDTTDGIANATATLIAPAVTPASPPPKKPPPSPFEVGDFMCVAPLAVLDNALYAGGQRGGSLYRLAEP